jgi:hypothetical protein
MNNDEKRLYTMIIVGLLSEAENVSRKSVFIHTVAVTIVICFMFCM